MSRDQQNLQKNSAPIVPIDRLMRTKTPVDGTFTPAQLPDLQDYLVSDAGEICYQFTGNVLTDQSGTKKRQVKCIISGWFEIADAVTLQPTRFVLDINSNLVLVSTEQELPALDAESDDEDYVVCSNEFNVLDRVQEEILLAIPGTTPRQSAPSVNDRTMSGLSKRLTGTSSAVATAGAAGEKQESPFAKLAVLKKSG